MKMVYIASPLRGDYNRNIKNAVEYCKNACNIGVMALAPHIIFSQWYNDTIPEQREQGLGLGLELLKKADELWVMGERISQGMRGEIQFAHQYGIPTHFIEKPLDLESYPISADSNNLLTGNSCIEGSHRDYLEGQIIVVKFDRLKQEYRNPLNQLWKATHGNGCNPEGIGRSIFLEHIAGGDRMVVYRSEVCGIVKSEVLEQVKSQYFRMQSSDRQDFTDSYEDRQSDSAEDEEEECLP